MNEPSLWSINHLGNVYKLTLSNLSWQAINVDDPESVQSGSCHRNAFKRLSVSKKSAWAIGSDQKVYMKMFTTDVPIRVKESCYENQRWSITRGWSDQSLLPTDRWSWSNEAGTKLCEKEGFQLPSPSWVWDGDWFIDMSIKCDEDGWQYALDFPATYHRQQGRLTFVKRRRWSRYRKFVKFNTWTKIAGPDQTYDPFQDVAVGGSEIPGQEHGFLAVWALTFSGKVLYRRGVTFLTPEGLEWVQINSDDRNIIQLSVGPHGLLWGTTWDGSAVVRLGISHCNQTGSAWADVPCPVPAVAEESGLFQVAVGSQAVWALSRNCKVYFRRGIDSRNWEENPGKLVGSEWLEMVGTFAFLSLGPNEQVWALGSEDGHVYVRSDVTPLELMGRQWKMLKTSQASAKKTAAECKHNWVWLSSGACEVSADFFARLNGSRPSTSSLQSLSGVDAGWRRVVILLLQSRNATQSDAHEALENPSSHEGNSYWSKRSQCQMLTDAYYKTWSKCHIKLQSGIGDANPTLLIYYSQKGRYEEIKIFLSDILAVCRIVDTSQLYAFAIHTQDLTLQKQPLTVSLETEKELTDWMSAITIERNRMDNFVSSNGATSSIWVTNLVGDVFMSVVEDVHNANRLVSMHWTQVPGHMARVVCGKFGILWAIGFDRKVYVYSGGRRWCVESAQHTNNLLETVEDKYVYENQRWNPIEGYAERRLPSDRWPWSDESGIHCLTKDTYRLPSASQRWIGEWTVDFDIEGGTDKRGWQYAVDFPWPYHSHKGIHDYVRRRRWKRPCKTSVNCPWKEIKSDLKVLDLSMQMDGPSGLSTSCGVWAIGCNGQAMYRAGVTKDCPEGTSWIHIGTEIPLLSVSVGADCSVWCIAQDGSAYVRAGFRDNPKTGTHWFHIVKQKLSLCHISVGRKLILALDRQGTLFHRKNVSAIFPEGTEWFPVLYGISHVSVSASDQVWIIRDGDLIALCNDAESFINPTDRNMHTVLTGAWSSVCIRGWKVVGSRALVKENGSVEPVESVVLVKDSERVYEPPSLCEVDGPVAKVDPYKVDIYNFFDGSKVDPNDVDKI